MEFNKVIALDILDGEYHIFLQFWLFKSYRIWKLKKHFFLIFIENFEGLVVIFEQGKN